MGRVRSAGGVVIFGAALLLAAALGSADTLVLDDGDRLKGELIGFDGETFEFRESGFFGRVRRFGREEVRAIEFSGHEDSSRANNRPKGMREKDLRVSARTAWTDTGINVRQRQEIYFAASGKVRWGKGRKDDAGGESGRHHNPNRPIPQRPAAALIGKIGGNSTDYFFIGNEEGPFRMRSSGRLFLGINDDYLPDNSGAFSVTISY